MLHALGDEGVVFREIAGAIGRKLDLPTASVSPADTFSHFGPLGIAVAVDGPASAAFTQELLGWKPTRPGLLEDLDQDHYYR